MSEIKEKTLTTKAKSDSVGKVKSSAQKSRKKSSSERLEEVKAKRKRPPLNNPNRFNVKETPGYHKRIVSDKEYDFCVERGYTPDPDYKHTMRTQDPSQIGSARVSLGAEDHGTVMRQRQEDHDADQAEKLEIDKKNQASLLSPITENPHISSKLDVKKVNFEDI